MKQTTTLRNVVALCATTLMLLLHAGTVNAQTAKAIWCAGNTTLYFTYDDVTYAEGDTYDGQTITKVMDVYEAPASGIDVIPWYYNSTIRGNITNVVVKPNFYNYKPASVAGWFHGQKKLSTIEGLANINTSLTTNMYRLFWSCEALTSIDGVQNWDTSNVSNFSGIFSKCPSLTSIQPVSGWNTSKVTSLSEAFRDCTSLTSLEGLENWDTSNNTTLYEIFRGCSSLTSLQPLKTWNTGKVSYMWGAFSTCSSLTSLEGLEDWDVSKVQNMSNAFAGCTGVTSIQPLSGWVTSNVIDLSSTFANCSSVLSLEPLSGWDVSKVTNVEGTFDRCRSVTSLEPLTNWEISNITSLSCTFQSCESITSLHGLENWDVSQVTNMWQTFVSCSNLTSLEAISGWETGNVKTMGSTFGWCSSITSLDPLSGWDTSNVTTMEKTFAGCSNIRSLEPISGWTTSNVTTLSMTFDECTSLTSLHGLENWDTSNVTTLLRTFAACKGLSSLEPLSGWNISKVGSPYNLQKTFMDCSGLKSLHGLENWDVSNISSLIETFMGCSGITTLEPISGWTTSNLTSLSHTFEGCTNLITADLSRWNLSGLNRMEYAFKDCANLRGFTFGANFRLGNSDFSGLTYVFDGCLKLRYIDFYDANCELPSYYSQYGIEFPLFFLGLAPQLPSQLSEAFTTFVGVPETTVIYLPKGFNGEYNAIPGLVEEDITINTTNVVYSYEGDGADLRCTKYYSEDKVDIELPHTFTTNTAEYTRTMGTTYGSVILPYKFESNSNIQAYTLDDEYTKEMFFKDAATVDAHTPFAFKKLNNADFTMTDESNNFGITVEETHTTSAAEGGTPYEAGTNLDGWTTKGYYVNETVADYDGTFYISNNKFYKADGALTLYPHRVTFHGAWAIEDFGTKSIKVLGDETDAIDAAEARMAEQNEIYDAQGRQLNTLTRGLNIIRMSDGTTRKVIRK